VRRLDPEIPVNALMTLEDANWQEPVELARLVGASSRRSPHCPRARDRRTGLADRLCGRAAQPRARHSPRRWERRRPAWSCSCSAACCFQILVGVVVGSIGAKAWDPATTAGDLAAAALLVVVVIVTVSSWPAGARRTDRSAGDVARQ
jgi:hypothetical protein